MLPSFAADGFLPLGRYSVSFEEAESMLVDAVEFQDSPTRRTLWEGLDRYIQRFFALEDAYLDDARLIQGVWLGGSFVSSKYEPRNIDAALLIDVEAERAVRGNPGSKWLTSAFKSRDSIREKFGVSPLRIGYHRVAHVFEPERFTPEERTYFTERGVWDDWWQRCRLPDQEARSPSEQSAIPARGYLEVRL
ncbi:DUF6932 family protein [Streptomyces hydrogenans]|uniref:DUF6932 family protein n=1 Tax=Streptomyces hydrogenans TaxID=1873719 RepID=UPI0035D59473